jgi:hypothetical protein
MIYAALFSLAIALNMGCKKSLLLTLVVGLSALIPMQIALESVHNLSIFINFEVDKYYIWFAICLGFEALKIITALVMKLRIGYPLVFINGLMFLCHASLLVTTDWQPHTFIVPALEHLEIISCALFSTPSLIYLKRKFRCLKI